MNLIPKIQFGRTWVFDKAALQRQPQLSGKLHSLQLLRGILTQGSSFEPKTRAPWPELTRLQVAETPDVLIVSSSQPHSRSTEVDGGKAFNAELAEIMGHEQQLDRLIADRHISHFIALPDAAGKKLSQALNAR